MRGIIRWTAAGVLAGMAVAAVADARPVAAASAGGGRKEAELADRLKSASPDERRSAVKALAKLGGRRGWGRVLEALGDSEGQVADQAQLALGGLDEERVLDDLLGKKGLRSRDERVRRRAAEALGRVGLPVECAALARALGDRDEEVRRRVLWTVERLARREELAGDPAEKLLPVVERKGRGDREPGVRAAALATVAALDEEVARTLAEEGLEDRREEVRCAALGILGADRERVGELARRLYRDPSSRVRSQLIEVLEAAGNRDGARGLVVCLENEERLRLRWSAVEALRRLSGYKYRLDVRPWRAWSDRLARSWRPERGKPADVPRGATRVFGGMPLLSDRVCFLFDLSGSLWNRREDGTTRKQYADTQLRLALGSLPEGSSFNIVPYTDEPHPWSDELVPATERNLARALADFEACTESGRGNFYDAALTALEDPEVDTILVLTDGAPTGGEVWSLDLMVPMLLERDRFRKVRFDAVLVDAPKGLHRHWRALAAGTGGQVVTVEADS